ncbi:hypothetical protein C808_01988 [Lachnospiraceae bacterium M18-1]|nr:hypothetical protein C808_01988 [Lachnospiraceae bacterium M18-1]
MNTINIPVGTSNFAEIRRKGSYFIDKSSLIEQLLKTQSTKVTLITRPRRFGKTLGMSMLSEFFDIQKNSRALFEGLSVMKNKGLCRQWMNQYPTLFLSFRSVDGLNFSGAYAQLASVIAELYKKHIYLTESVRIQPLDKEQFHRTAAEKADLKGIKNSLLKLTQLMELHYQKPVILIIDEYDVPLAKASEKGYYREMQDAIKGVMQVVKDNNSLEFAVITGCLQIAKESIFTGTNNFVSDTISDTQLNEYFGFTQDEVNRLLADTGLAPYAEEIREWYDGYHFGDFDVYCPWDVMNHVQNLLLNPDSKPKNFWENTSDNSIIRTFLKRTDFDINDKFETLLAGEYIVEPIEENLTYDVLESSEENLWSLLYLTGYLTRLRPDEIPGLRLLPGHYALKVPNKEVLGIFKKSVKAWLMETTAQKDRNELFAALWDENAQRLTELISDLLFDTISYHDYAESFYHAFLTGLFSNAGYRVESNYENGLGRSDLVVKDRRNRRAVVLEAKRTYYEDQMENACEEALSQIREKQYAEKVERDGYKKAGRLGLAFFQKKCLVKKG